MLIFNLNAGLSNLMVAICFAWRLLGQLMISFQTQFFHHRMNVLTRNTPPLTNSYKSQWLTNQEYPQFRITANFMCDYLWRTKSPPSKTRAASPKIVLRIATTDRLGGFLMRYIKTFFNVLIRDTFYNCASWFSVPKWNTACMTSNCTWNPLGPQVWRQPLHGAG